MLLNPPSWISIFTLCVTFCPKFQNVDIGWRYLKAYVNHWCLLLNKDQNIKFILIDANAKRAKVYQTK